MSNISSMNMEPITDTILQTHTYDEVLKSAIEYFGGDELAATTWMNKYAVKDAQGNYYELTPNDMHHRMAREFAKTEMKFSEESKLNGNSKNLSVYGQHREFLSEEKIYNYFKKFQ